MELLIESIDLNGCVRGAKPTDPKSKTELWKLCVEIMPEIVRVGWHSGSIFIFDTMDTVMKLLSHGNGEL